MSSLDTFFKVKTGLGVGTDTLYASALDRNVAIGKTIANPLYKLDVIGSIYSDENVIVDNNVGVGTTAPFQALDVRGKGVFSTGVGIGTTNPIQVFQVNNNSDSVVITGVGSFGIGTLYPLQDFHYVGINSSNSVVITGIASVGIRTTSPIHDFQLISSLTNTNVVITKSGFVGVNILTPNYNVDIAGDLRVSGLATITNEFVGVSTIGFATITREYVGLATIGFATITNEFVGISTIGFATITSEYVGVATIGFATITNEYVGISTIGFATITNEYVGISTIGFATISSEYVGIATIGFATISSEYVGIATIGFATISNEYAGIATIGFATISSEYVGIATIGFATITNEFVGVSTIGFASITNEFVGVSTIGFASITNAYVGVATVGFATITTSYTGIGTIGIATIGREKVVVSEIDQLLVTGITTTAKLDVGIGATLTRIASQGITSVTDLSGNLVKNIHPIVGIATTLPTRTLDIAGDLRVRGEVIDSNNAVGYAYSVLSSSGTPGITGRFLDGANLLLRNKDFIAAEVVGFITSTAGPFGAAGTAFDYGTAGPINGRKKCKRDIGLIIDAIAFDITKGGNSASVGAGSSYYNGVVLKYLDDSSTIPYGLSAGYVKQATIAGISSIAYIAKYVINNAAFPTSYQYGPYYNRNSDAVNLITANKQLIAEVAVDRMLTQFPGFSVPNGNQNCIDDIILILDAITYNLKYTGNDKVWDAAQVYITGGYLAGEETQALYAYEQVRTMAIQAMRNETIVITGSSLSQIKDLTVITDSSSPTCQNVASAISSFVGIVTQAIYTGSISSINKTYAITGFSQLIDSDIAADGDSNTNLNGCSNVVSAIGSCVGIVTTIISNGLSAAPKINYPSGKLEWKPPGPRIGNEWFVNKLGSDTNGGTGPGDAFLTIKKASSIAQPGDTIKVYAGLYIEDGPISLNERVAVVGEDLRRTLVTTRDKTDLYYVKRGCYISQQSFIGESNPGKAMVSFPTQGYGYADGTEQNWQSPYVQNCTNFVPDSIGMRIDGNRAGGFKSMVLDAYTQYNQGGIGVSITNFGYAQLVSLFTICCDTAVFCDSGGVCDLNNSNCSFGNYALVSNGATPLQYTGTITSIPSGDNIDSLTINVGVGASQAYIDSAELLRLNKDFIASETVGFVTSTAGPFGAAGTAFDYGGSSIGREICRRDSKLIVEAIASDILNLGNLNSINAGLAYRDSIDGSLTYLPETSPPPTGLSTGYVKQAELSMINYIAGISTYIAQNVGIPTSYQVGVGSFAQVKDYTKSYSSNVNSFISSRAGIITSIIGIGTTAAPAKILPKGQRPYDGQIAYIDTQYYFISSIKITNPGSGYSNGAPVEVVVDLPPNSNYFIPAEAAIFETDVTSQGTIGSIQVLVSGTGYNINNPPAVSIAGPPGVGTTATAVAVLEKYFFHPRSSTAVSAGGTTTVTFDEFITYPIGIGSTVYFYQSSKIIASSITFEYVGTGINIVNAIPSKGAVPITDNQIVATNGGQVPFTSTDQGGNFRISEGITINQNTGTISGQAFSKSLQAEVTPLIIALQQ
jgi:hypothetical protein